MEVSGLGREDHRVQLRPQVPVDLGHLVLPVEVDAVAHALDQGLGPLLPGEVGQKAVPCGGAGIGDMGDASPHQLQALVQGKHGALLPVGHDADNDLIEDAGCALHKVQMAHGDRVEASGADGGSHLSTSSSRW